MNDAVHPGGTCSKCGLESGDEALFCARCGESLMTRPREAWYLRTSILILASLAVLPIPVLVLPLVWINPRFSTTKKAVISAVMAVVTAILLWCSVYSLKQIATYYEFMWNPLPGVEARRGEEAAR